MNKLWQGRNRGILCVCLIVFMLVFIVSGCGKEEGRVHVPSDQLPEGVLEYTVPAFSDEVEFAAVFVSAAISMRLEADRYNALVCRFDAENGDPDKLEELLEKTRDAYEAADKMAAMALDVSVALAELEKTPGYSPYKTVAKEKKTALLDGLFTKAYAKDPYVMRREPARAGGIGVGDTRMIEYLSNGTWRFEGETGVKGQLWDENRYNAWKKEEKQESELEVKARERAVKEREEAEKKAKAETAATIKKMEEDARDKQAASTPTESISTPSYTYRDDTEAIVAKYGYNEILEVYDKFAPGQNLRGLAKYLKIGGSTNYEVYQRTLEVYKRAKQYAELRGVTVTQADEINFQNNNFKAKHITITAGKCAEAGLACFDPRNVIDKSHALAKANEAASYVVQTGYVLATDDENEGWVKEWQNKSEKISMITGSLQIGNKLVTGEYYKSLKNAYDLFKNENIIDAAKKVLTLKNVYDFYGDTKTVYDVYQNLKETRESNKKLQAEADNTITAQSQTVNDDGSITVRTMMTSPDDPDKDKKLTAVTGLTGDELTQAEKEATEPPKERSVEDEEKSLSEGDKERVEIMEWLRSPDFQLVLNLADDMQQPFAVDKVVGIYHKNTTQSEEGITAQGSYTIRVHKIDEYTISMSYTVVASAGDRSENIEDTITAGYDPATGQILDGSGMHFVNAGGSICLSAGELGLVPRQ